MDGREIAELSTELALELPGVTTDQPFGFGVDVFRVGGKIFLILMEGHGVPLATMKCDPEEAVWYREEFRSVVPGYHMNKKHWISVRPGGDVTPELLEELVEGAHAALVASLPRSRRPAGMRPLTPGPPTQRPGTE